MREVVVRRRNLKEAAKQASFLLASKVEFQVLDPGSSGFSGKGERTVVTRAWKARANDYSLKGV